MSNYGMSNGMLLDLVFVRLSGTTLFWCIILTIMETTEEVIVE